MMLFRYDGYLDSEGCTLARLAVSIYMATMTLDEAIADTQT
jgi:hypothetical protein